MRTTTRPAVRPRFREAGKTYPVFAASYDYTSAEDADLFYLYLGSPPEEDEEDELIYSNVVDAKDGETLMVFRNEHWLYLYAYSKADLRRDVPKEIEAILRGVDNTYVERLHDRNPLLGNVLIPVDTGYLNDGLTIKDVEAMVDKAGGVKGLADKLIGHYLRYQKPDDIEYCEFIKFDAKNCETFEAPMDEEFDDEDDFDESLRRRPWKASSRRYTENLWRKAGR